MKFILFLFLTFMAGSVFCQLNVRINWQPVNASPKSDTIYYSANSKLNWTNFQKKDEEGSNAAALTTSGFGFGAGLHTLNDKGTLTINVFCYFLKSRSWYKEKYRNEYVLNHEQHHFDIAYLGANYFVKKLKTAKFTTKNYSALLQSIYEEAYTYMDNLQDQYDGETSNGRLKDKQASWNKLINEQLGAFTN